jgi:pilus assembly protein CpaF
MKLEQALGPLAKHFEKSHEIMVDSFDDVYIEVNGELQDVNNIFKSSTEVEKVIRNLMSFANVEFKDGVYNYDFTVDEQTRVNVVFPPMSQKGPALNMLKIAKQSLTWEDFLKWDVVTKKGQAMLKEAIDQNKNILVAGPAGSGKTTLLNVLASTISEEQRVITVERTPSLVMNRKRTSKLMAPNNKVSEMPSLIAAAGKMRPDYIVHSYVEGPETVDFLNTIREGYSAMALVGGENVFDAIKSLELKAMACSYGHSVEDIRYTIASAFDLIVFQEMLDDGSRKITKIAEISYIDGKVDLDVLYKL